MTTVQHVFIPPKGSVRSTVRQAIKIKPRIICCWKQKAIAAGNGHCHDYNGQIISKTLTLSAAIILQASLTQLIIATQVWII